MEGMETLSRKMEEMGWVVAKFGDALFFTARSGLKVELKKQVTPIRFIESFDDLSKSIGHPEFIDDAEELKAWYKNITGGDFVE